MPAARVEPKNGPREGALKSGAPRRGAGRGCVWLRQDSKREPCQASNSRASSIGLGDDHRSDGFWSTVHNRSWLASPSCTGCCVAARACADLERISWPSRGKRSVVRMTSSCNGVPTIWAINPIKTADCAIKRSCNGGLTGLAVWIAEPIGCSAERSCNAVSARRPLRHTRDGATAMPGPGRRSSVPGSSLGSRARRANVLG